MGRIVFEMSGIPGGGKTTLANMIVGKFIEYDFLTDVSFYRKKKKIISRIRTLVYWLSPRYKEIKRILKFMESQCVIKEKQALFLKKKLGLVRCLGLYNRYIPKNNIALSEGVIQGLFELMDYVEVSEREKAIEYCMDILKEVRRVLPRLKFFLLLLDYNIADNRINIRNDIYNSVDRMEREKRLQFLMQRYENAMLLYQKCKYDSMDVIFLNGEKSFTELLTEISSHLCGV